VSTRIPIDEQRDALERDLSPEHWKRVHSLLSDEFFHHTAHLARVLAAHLPGVGPAIFALADHAREEDPDGGCCGLPARDYAEGTDARDAW
jgi:hypothetical protein